MRGSVENIGDSLFEAQTSLAKRTSAHEHPYNLDRSELVHRDAIGILERQTSEKSNDEPDIGSKHVLNEPLDIVKDAPTLLDSVEDRGKVIVGEDDI